ncbi:MAG TPA: hypothetical protein VGH38_38150, partial [Bryobacteraceae bacterium]
RPTTRAAILAIAIRDVQWSFEACDSVRVLWGGPCGLWWRKRQFDVDARRQRGEGFCHIVGVLSDEPPIGSHQHHDRQTAIRKILLIAEIFIRGDDRGKALRFRRTEKLAVFQCLPAALKCGDDGPLCGFEAALTALQHGIDLRPRDARKPFQELLHGGASFNVLEERFHRDTRTFEKPGAADFFGNPLHGGTL